MAQHDAVAETADVQAAGWDEFVLTLDIEHIPATYVGRLICDLGQLYREVTGDIMLLSEAEAGSLRLKFRAAASQKFRSFVRILRGIFAPYSEEKISRTVQDNIDALTSRLPDQREANQLSREKLQAEIANLDVETKLKVFRELPDFADKLLDLAIKVDPNASTEKKQRVVEEAIRTYTDAFGIQARLDLAEYPGQEHLQQLDNLRDRFKLEYRPEESKD